jgi:hypothetical protein
LDERAIWAGATGRADNVKDRTMPTPSDTAGGHQARRERRNRKAGRALVLKHEGEGRGITNREIAQVLSAEFGEHVAVGTVRNYLWDRDGGKARRIKEGYRGACKECGEPMSGGGGPRGARDYCQRHKHLRPASALRKHTPKSIKATLRRWYRAHGFWPNSHDLSRHWAKQRGGEPLRRFEQLELSASTVAHHFGTVKAGIQAAQRDDAARIALPGAG